MDRPTGGSALAPSPAQGMRPVKSGGSSPLVRYLTGLTLARGILWGYLIWYLFAVASYFDPAPRLWLSSVGISAIIGTALYLSTVRAGGTPIRLEWWQRARLFIMPFCVSSFAAVIKDRGFFLIFHPTLVANLEVIALCGVFAGVVLLLKLHARRGALALSAREAAYDEPTGV